MPKPRGIAHLLANLPPIDWSMIAAERYRSFRKGSKHTRETLERMKKGRAKTRKRKAKAIARRRRERLKERPRKCDPRPAVTLRHKLVAAMEPGHWYARPDLRELTGLPYGSIKARTVTMTAEGVLESARNPAAPAKGMAGYNPARGGVYRKGIGIQWQTAQEPEFLFRLTAKGEQLRAGMGYAASAATRSSIESNS